MLELWGMQSTPLLPLLPGPLWSGVVIHLNKLEYEIMKDYTSEDNKNEIEEIDDSRIEDGLTYVRESDQDESNMILCQLKPEIIKAKEQELENLIAVNVYKEVQDSSQWSLSTLWLEAEKPLTKGKKANESQISFK